MSHAPGCIRFQTAAGYDPNLPCSCGASAELQVIDENATRPRPPHLGTRVIIAARAWAAADRLADDRTADVVGIERVIVNTPRPIPPELLAARERASLELREACKAEGDAEEAMRDAARSLLDDASRGGT